MRAEHLADARIEQLVTAQLTGEELEAALQHVTECDACMAKAEAMWKEQPAGAALERALELDSEKARKMESHLLRRINRSNLGSSVVQFGLGGFSNVLLALVRPFVSRSNPPRKGKKHD